MNDSQLTNTVSVGLSADAILFFTTVFALGAAAGFFRSARDRDFVSIGNLFSIAVCSGFLGFSSVAFLCRTAGDAAGLELFYLGIASFVGLLGKEQDLVIQWAVKSLFLKLGIHEHKTPDAGPPDDR